MASNDAKILYDYLKLTNVWIYTFTAKVGFVRGHITGAVTISKEDIIYIAILKSSERNILKDSLFSGIWRFLST